MLVAYAKLALKEDILASSIPDDPYFERTLAELLPAGRSASTYAGELAEPPAAPRDRHQRGRQLDGQPGRHHLRLPRRRRRPGATPEQVTRAFVVCREVFGLADYVREVEALDNVVPTAAQTALYLEFRRLLDRSVRWFLTSRPVDARHRRRDRAVLAASCATCAPRCPSLLRGRGEASPRPQGRRAGQGGVPEELAVRAASLLDWYSLLDIVDIATDTGREPTDVAPLYYLVSERFGIDAMLSKVTGLPRDDRWDALARGALRDDLYSVLESLTRSVIEVGDRRRRPGPAVGGVGEGQQGVDAAQQDRAVGDPAARPPQHRGAVGGAAHAALGHPGRRLHLTAHRYRPIADHPPELALPGTIEVGE